MKRDFFLLQQQQQKTLSDKLFQFIISKYVAFHIVYCAHCCSLHLRIELKHKAGALRLRVILFVGRFRNALEYIKFKLKS